MTRKISSSLPWTGRLAIREYVGRALTRLGLSLGALTLMCAALPAQIEFDTHRTYELAELFPRDVAVVDLDGDQVPELVCIGFAPEESVVLKRTLDGNFIQSQLFDVGGTAPSRVVSAHLNRDPHPDICVLHETTSTFAVLLGSASGLLGPPQILSSGGSGPRDLLAGDYDEDGDVDIAISHRFASGNVVVHFGDGVGGFGTPVVVPVASMRGMESVDFNGDGHLDFVFRSFFDIDVLLGDGAGGFVLESLDLPFSVDSFCVADFDEDGLQDLAVNKSASGCPVVLLLNDGQGGFAPTVEIPLQCALFMTLSAAKIDNDEHWDVIVRLVGIEKTMILLGDGQGGLEVTQEVLAAGPRSQVVDVDGDGVRDLLAANEDFRHVAVHRGLGGGMFQGVPHFETGDLREIAAGDFDEDGVLDIVSANGNGQHVTIVFGDGEGGFSPPVEIGLVQGSKSVAIGDLNGDGHLDAALTPNQASVAYFLGDGAGGFSGPWSAPTLGSGGYRLTAADLDDDGFDDLVVPLFVSDAVAVLIADGVGGFFSPMLHLVADDPRAALAADLDGDDDLDVVVAHGTSGGLTILRGDGTGGFVQESVLTSPPAGRVIAADFNGDDHLDLAAVGGWTMGGAAVHLGAGDGSFSPAEFYALGGTVSDIAAVDLDLDGATDLAVLQAFGGVRVLRGLGDGTFETVGEYSFGTALWPESIAAGDFDGDVWGRTDLVAGSFVTAGISLLRNITDVERFRRGDVNADGAVNIADPVYLLSYLFVPGSAAVGCEDAADADDNGVLDLADAILLLDHLFGPVEPPLPAPSGRCGADPTEDPLPDCVFPTGSCP